MNSEPPFTRRQKDFFRRLLSSPGPLPRDQWPSPVILRRWLRNSQFKNALNEIRTAYRFQTDFYLDGASARAAANLETRFDSVPDGTEPRDLLHTIRLVHTRQRFEPEPIAEKPFPHLPWFETMEEQERALGAYERYHQSLMRELKAKGVYRPLADHSEFLKDHPKFCWPPKNSKGQPPSAP